MVKKICLIASLAGMLLNPQKSVGADFTVFDQFADAIGTGLFQGVDISSELNLESASDSGSTQGINVISLGAYSGQATQVALMEADSTLTMLEGSNVIQGINVYRGSADAITQMMVSSGSVTMTSRNNIGGIQSINIITNCDSCN